MGRAKSERPVYGLQLAPGGAGYITGDGEYLRKPPVSKAYRGSWIAAHEKTIRTAFHDSAKWGLRGRAFGSRARGVRSFEIEANNTRISFINPASWGVASKGAETIQTEMRVLQEACKQTGTAFRPTAASWAMSVYRNEFEQDEPGGMHQLPPVYRPLVIRSYYGGPIVMARAQSTPSRSIDRVRAYAGCMEQEVPVGRPVEVAHLSWPHLRDHAGIVDATVHIAEGLDLPPLPVRLEQDGIIIYPVGTFRGVWTIQELAAMERRGDGAVLRLHEGLIFDAEPVFAPMMERMNQWEDQGFAWAKFATNAFTGKWAQHSTETAYCNYSDHEVRALHPDGEIHEDDHGIRWVIDPEDLWGKRPPTYRPQVSAWIVGNNRASVFDSIRRMKKDSVAYVHVDALWTTDLVSDPGPGWREEGVYARSRHYASGIYSEEGGTLGHAGMAVQPTVLELEKIMARQQDQYHTSATEMSRCWSAPPGVDVNATSRPWLASEIDLPRRSATSLPRVHWWSDQWSEHGYPMPGSRHYSPQWDRRSA